MRLFTDKTGLSELKAKVNILRLMALADALFATLLLIVMVVCAEARIISSVLVFAIVIPSILLVVDIVFVISIYVLCGKIDFYLYKRFPKLWRYFSPKIQPIKTFAIISIFVPLIFHWIMFASLQKTATEIKYLEYEPEY